MKADKLAALVVVSIVIAILLATALTSFTRVSDSALAEVATPRANVGAGSSRPSTAEKNYLPIIFLNSATAGGAWLLAGNGGTNWTTDFLGTTDNMTLTFRVSNTIALRITPAVHPFYGVSPNLIGGPPVNSVAPGLWGATIAGGGVAGYANEIGGDGKFATISGGAANTVGGIFDVIGGGYYNTAQNDDSTVGGGTGNSASGYAATVPGGSSNTAAGAWSFAAGQRAQANHQGAFVWADSTNSAFASTAANQFLVRANGGVGIGTNAPAAALHVAAPEAHLRLQSNLPSVWTVTEYSTTARLWHTGVGGPTVVNDVKDKYYVWDGQFRLVVDTNGNVGIGTTAPGSKLEVNGVIRVDSLGAAGSTGLCLNASKEIATCSSSLRYKNNVADLTRGLDAVAQLRPVTFNWKNTNQPDVGFVAEEVNQVMPELTTLNSEGQIEGVKYDRVSALLVKGMQEQQKEIEGLRGENEKELKELIDLKSEVATLKAQQQNDLDEVKSRLAALEQGQSPASNALTMNSILPWGIVGLVAVWAMRRGRGTEDGRRGRDAGE